LSNLLRLDGPAGVGKSALAQTVAEYCQNQGWLVATFFFSRPNKRDDPNRLVPSLAYQLAVHVKSVTYKHSLDLLLAHDPSILDTALPVQFQRLIADPLSAYFNDTADRVLIVLDGLDECKGDSAQREIITLVVAFSQICRVKGLPVFFTIFSRPEWQIISAFSKADPHSFSQKEKLDVGDHQSRADFELFLRDRFKDIRTKYEYLFTVAIDPWPTEEQLYVLIAKGNGLFVFGETALRFIEDDEVGDPVTQLEICLDFLKGNHVPIGVDPFDPLASLYRGILSKIHQQAIHMALHLLYPLLPDFRIYALYDPEYIASFMDWSPASYLSCLQRLRSVVRVPDDGPLMFHHASFGDFLKDILITGEYGLTSGDILKTFKQRALEWYRAWKRYGDDPSEECVVGEVF
jgi:hypothetical protein